MRMKLYEFFDILNSGLALRDDYIVCLRYKYDWEKEYMVENQYLEYDGRHDEWVWLNDWNEGQTDVEVIDFISIQDVFLYGEEDQNEQD